MQRETTAMSDADQLYDEALNLKAEGKVEEAVAKWQESLAAHPDHALTHQALAVHLQKLGQNDDAIQHAVKVTELAPNDPFSFTQLSVIYQRCGKIQEAEDAMARSRMMQGH